MTITYSGMFCKRTQLPYALMLLTTRLSLRASAVTYNVERACALSQTRRYAFANGPVLSGHHRKVLLDW